MFATLLSRRPHRGGHLFSRPLQSEPLENRLLLDARLVADINETPQVNSSYPDTFVQVGNETVLFLTEIDGGRQIYRTDGTPDGTWRLFDTPLLDGSEQVIENLAAFEDTAYFQSLPWLEEGDIQTWKTDGTNVDLVESLYTFFDPDLRDGRTYVELQDDLVGKVDMDGELVEITSFFAPTAVVDDLLYVQETRSLLVSDGQGGDWTIGPFPDSPFLRSQSVIHSMFPVENTMYFFSRLETHVFNGLWKTDGTNVELVKELDLTFVGEMQSANGLLFFTADDSVHGVELWRTDGTAEGTFMVRDIHLETGSDPADLAAFGERLFFAADDGVSGAELWTSDGTAEGTTLVADIAPDSAGSAPSGLTTHEGRLYFSADDVEHGAELWLSDGTTAGTMLAVDIAEGPESSYPVNITSALGRLFLNASGNTGEGQEPWVSDGTPAGTGSLGNLAPDGNQGSLLRDLTRVGDMVYFAANDGVHGQELWRSDGTTAGTMMVKDISPGPNSADVSGIWNIDGTVYFAASDGVHGMELWTTDGTETGTRMVADIEPGFAGSGPYDLTRIGNEIYFVAFDDDHGEELWKTDGTEAGTVLVQDVLPGPDGSYPRQLTGADGELYFVAGSQTDEQLWRSNGQPGQAVLVTSASELFYENLGTLTWIDGELFFLASESQVGFDGPLRFFSELFRTNGQLVEPVPVPSFSPIETIIPYGSGLLLVESSLGFRGNIELYRFWEYNLETSASTLLSEFDLGPNGSGGGASLFGDDSVLVSVFRDQSELWVHELTSGESRRIVGDEINELGDPLPELAEIHNDLLLFRANGQTVGTEVWASNGTLDDTFLLADIAPGIEDSFPSNLVVVNDTLYVRADDGSAGTELWAIDLPTVVSFAEREFVARESDGMASYRLIRGGDVSAPLSVRIDIVGGTATNVGPVDPPVPTQPDYWYRSPRIISFAAGEAEATFQIPIVRDDIEESEETIELQLTDTGSAVTGIRSGATVVLVDSTGATADLNGDGLYNVNDLNLLIGQIVAGGNGNGDLNGDGNVDLSDIDAWLAAAGERNLPSGQPYPRADVNLDGVVDATDLGEIRLFRPRQRWERGNLNADLVVDGSDFNIWNDHKFTDNRGPIRAAARQPRAPLATLEPSTAVRAMALIETTSDRDLHDEPKTFTSSGAELTENDQQWNSHWGERASVSRLHVWQVFRPDSNASTVNHDWQALVTDVWLSLLSESDDPLVV